MPNQLFLKSLHRLSIELEKSASRADCIRDVLAEVNLVFGTQIGIYLSDLTFDGEVQEITGVLESADGAGGQSERWNPKRDYAVGQSLVTFLQTITCDVEPSLDTLARLEVENIINRHGILGFESTKSVAAINLNGYGFLLFQYSSPKTNSQMSDYLSILRTIILFRLHSLAGGRSLEGDGIETALSSIDKLGLSYRQREIAAHVAEDMGIRKIASTIGYSQSLVKMELVLIYRKFGVQNKGQLLELISAWNSQKKELLFVGE